MSAFDRVARPYKLRLADADTISKRLSICIDCDKFDDGECSLCGCNMKAKVSYEEARCGESKW